MAVAVWDTYVKKSDGSVMHFDIIVDATLQDPNQIYQFGIDFLKQKKVTYANLSAEECQFCHIEEPSEEMSAAIQTVGYFILEMEEIPARLGPQPTRKEVILFLKAHYGSYRFFNFQGVSYASLQEILKKQNMDRLL